MSDGKAGPPLKFITFHCGGCNKTAVLDGRGAAECECVRITQAKEQRMNIDDAVRVVDARRYKHRRWRAVQRGSGEWFAESDWSEAQPFPISIDSFAAIAIAEKLERQAGRDMPATRRVMKRLADDAAAQDKAGRECGYEWAEMASMIRRDELMAALAELEAKP